jgi:hypothetical protein
VPKPFALPLLRCLKKEEKVHRGDITHSRRHQTYIEHPMLEWTHKDIIPNRTQKTPPETSLGRLERDRCVH